MLQGVGVVVGILAGVVWEVLGTIPFGEHETLVPHLEVKLGSRVWQWHHWPLYLFLFVAVEVVAMRTGRMWHPAVVMLLSFLAAAMAYNIMKYPDWYKFVK